MDQIGSSSQDHPLVAPTASQPRRTGSPIKVLWTIIRGLAVVLNLVLILLVVGALIVAGGAHRGLQEYVIQSGPQKDKIVIIPVRGIIDSRLTEQFSQQIRAGSKDKAIKGLIIRISSPGGTISGSDQLYHQIIQYKQQTGVPVVAFMEGTAASGGYYVAVGCQRIVAEPTAITGSIGVLMGHFVLGGLLEDKLGIKPVVLKSGQKKDWPSSFDPPTPEQLDYLQERLLTPAYERFVEVVAEGRSPVLSADQVRALADGGIYTAPHALEEGLIDQVGYLDDAIDLVKSMAGLEKARVVEYRRAFSLMDLLVQAYKDIPIRLDRSRLFELTTPEPMYLWRAY
ncbi:MAG: signal peptide peptidase SppA [Sedimentisphaerales bacterium]|nr:signal peptide peptidase SppA [Sedimentisphaerales bacterium]